MPGSADPRSRTKGRSLFGGMSDRQLAAPLIALVMTLEVGWLVLTAPDSGDDSAEAMAAGYWAMLFPVPIAMGTVVAAAAVLGLARDRLWGLMAGFAWAVLWIIFSGFVFVALLQVSNPTENLARAMRSGPFLFGLATVASIAVLVLLVRDRRAPDRPSPPPEASPQRPIDDDHPRPRQVWPSSRRSSRRRRRPPPTAGTGGPA
jgi:hypothetical protein